MGSGPLGQRLWTANGPSWTRAPRLRRLGGRGMPCTSPSARARLGRKQREKWTEHRQTASDMSNPPQPPMDGSVTQGPASGRRSPQRLHSHLLQALCVHTNIRVLCPLPRAHIGFAPFLLTPPPPPASPWAKSPFGTCFFCGFSTHRVRDHRPGGAGAATLSSAAPCVCCGRVCLAKGDPLPFLRAVGCRAPPPWRPRARGATKAARAGCGLRGARCFVLGGGGGSPNGLFAQQEWEPIRGRPAVRGKRTYGGRPGQRVEEQGTGASRTQKHSEAGYRRPVDRGAWTAKTVKRPRQQPAHPQYANYWAPLTRKRHTMPHSAQSQHTNYWAPRTRKHHQQEHRPQRPTESSNPAKGRTGDCPGPRKGATTRRNVTQGVDLMPDGHEAWYRGGAPGVHWKGGRFPPPSLCPATVPLTPSASLNGICNRQ